MLQMFRRVRGSVSLMLIIILLPIVTYATMIVDGTRVNTAKTAVNGAGDLAMNAALSVYDTTMKDLYGIFAMCGGDVDKLGEVLETYFSDTLRGQISESDSLTEQYIDQMSREIAGSISGNGVDEEELVNHLSMQIEEMTLSGNKNSSLQNPAVLKAQIMEYMKYRAPVMFMGDIADKLAAFKGSKEQTDACNKQVEYTESLDGLGEKIKLALDEIYKWNNQAIKLGEEYPPTTMNSDMKKTNTEAFIDEQLEIIYKALSSATENMLYYKNLQPYFTEDAPGTKDKSYIADWNTVSQKSEWKLEGSYNENDVVSLQKKLEAIGKQLNDEEAEKIIKKIGNVSGDGYQYILNCNEFWEEYSFKDVANAGAAIAEYKTTFESYKSKYTELKNAVESGAKIYFTDTYCNLDTKKEKIKEYFKKPEDIKIKEGETERELTPQEIKNFNAYTENCKKLFDELGETGELNVTTTETEDKTTHNAKLEIESGKLDKYEKELPGLSAKIDTMYNKAKEIWDGYKTTAEGNLYSASNTKLSNFFKDLKEAKGYIESTRDKLAEVKTKIAEVNGKLQTWNEKIADCPDGSTKSTMQVNHDSEEDRVKEIECEALQNYVSGKISEKHVSPCLSAYDSLIKCLESYKYFGVQVIGGSLDVDTFVGENGTWRTTYDNATKIEKFVESDVKITAENLLKDYYKAELGCTALKIESQAVGGCLADNSRFRQCGFFEVNKDKCKCNEKRQATTKYGVNNVMHNKIGESYPDAAAFYKKMVMNTTNLSENSEEDKNKAVSEKQGELDKKIGDKSAEKSTEAPAKAAGGSTDNSSHSIGGSSQDYENITAVGSGNDDATKNSASNGNAKMDKAKNKEQNKPDSSFLDKFTQLIDSGIKAAYLEEYYTGMFSCYTTNWKDGKALSGDGIEKSIAGVPLSLENNVYYRTEQEYIIWGGSSPEAALGTNKLAIYGVRFCLNTIFAFTSASVQSTANSVAVAIAGWTGFGIPLVQAIVTLVLSAAESGIDLYDLCDGKKVPIYKSESTWTCSLGGAGKKVMDTAIDKGAELLSDFANDTIDNVEGKLDEYIKGMTQAITDSVSAKLNGILDPIAQEYLRTLDSAESAVPGEKDIKNQIDMMLDSWEKSLGDDNTIIAEGERAVLDTIGKGRFAQGIHDKLGELKSNLQGAPEILKKYISDTVDDFLANNVAEPLENFVKKRAADLRKVVDENIEKGTNKIKEGAQEKISEAFDKFSGTSNAAGIKNKNITTDGKDSKSISLDYKQYTKIFGLIAVLGWPEKTLERCGQLICVNCNRRVQEDRFHRDTCYTFVEMDARVKLRTIFDYSVSAGNMAADQEAGIYSGLAPMWRNSGESSLHYHSMLGY